MKNAGYVEGTSLAIENGTLVYTNPKVEEQTVRNVNKRIRKICKHNACPSLSLEWECGRVSLYSARTFIWCDEDELLTEENAIKSLICFGKGMAKIASEALKGIKQQKTKKRNQS